MSIYPILFSSTQLLFSNFIHDFNFIFIIAILSLVGSIILRSKKVIITQLVLFISIFILDKFAENILLIPLAIIQLSFGVFILFRLKKAIDRNYLLVMEKTHQLPRNVNSNSSNGSQSSFL
ncbi:hypothetical protein CIL05_20000 [Virgibacillus profundi]|uniref:Uncharacterized protein n=1 Tax=Virgibacillus profundi TaxID=2024555 RepID=A0A2A2I972_9BACI|nr:hypothetical protein [Virgibacillus profundi]PAV27834.1 hypothetical protein CIL05_20000 [Virgibacillus profundi]PXY51961.1 hypothetical protein CIT14_20365 [Virgibacillus profundi]